ncbi:ogr/Delta-like zinc finger family protein [Motiliproteus sp.]|uniref:ogr/Delta-like zinc finger family protein n=1 Tax=Motiliproteus sp. TaxID=1898955 RepID=UPI003BAB2258
MSGIYKMQCPHCQGPIRVRNSVAMHPLLRSTFLQCMNLACGATFRGQAEITHEISPPATPNPDINLPMAPAAIRRMAQHDNNEQQMDFDDLLDDQQSA